MELTYILVDFENVQPPDLDLLRGEEFRVLVFHGPHQNKLDMSVVKALQPLGERVEYIQSEKAGKNALDFHIAFSIGRRLEAHEGNGKAARFIVVSKDGGFDSVLRHVRSLGYAAMQGASIRDALRNQRGDNANVSPASAQLSASSVTTLSKPPKPATTAELPIAASAGHVQSNGNAAPSERQAALKKKTAEPSAMGVSARPTQTSTAVTSPATEAIENVIDRLRANEKNRPSKRSTLERHVPNLAGGNTSPEAAKVMMAELERRGVIKMVGNKLEYKIPKRKK